MAHHEHQECPAQVVGDTLGGEKVAHVEQVARMQAVERGYNLAAIQVGEGGDPDFGKAEAILDGLGEGA